eukprot:14059188-Alexandrium_andersonii.AAC.1
MKVLYAARMARPDLLKAVCTLARSINRWTERETKHPLRRTKYVYQQKDWAFVGWCGDRPEDLSLQVFADADFASDVPTARSTSGDAVKLVGPHSAFTTSCLSKMQTSVSHSTPETEIVALDQ